MRSKVWFLSNAFQLELDSRGPGHLLAPDLSLMGMREGGTSSLASGDQLAVGKRFPRSYSNCQEQERAPGSRSRGVGVEVRGKSRMAAEQQVLAPLKVGDLESQGLDLVQGMRREGVGKEAALLRPGPACWGQGDGLCATCRLGNVQHGLCCKIPGRTQQAKGSLEVSRP